MVIWPGKCAISAKTNYCADQYALRDTLCLGAHLFEWQQFPFNFHLCWYRAISTLYVSYEIDWLVMLAQQKTSFICLS